MSIEMLQQRVDEARKALEVAEAVLNIRRRLPERDEYQAGDVIKFIAADGNFYLYSKTASGKWSNRGGSSFTWEQVLSRPFDQGAVVVDVLVVSKWASILKRELP